MSLWPSSWPQTHTEAEPPPAGLDREEALGPVFTMKGERYLATSWREGEGWRWCYKCSGVVYGPAYECERPRCLEGKGWME